MSATNETKSVVSSKLQTSNGSSRGLTEFPFLEKTATTSSTPVPEDLAVLNRAANEGSYYDSVEDYVTRMGGTIFIKRILIANNGNAAIKAIRSMRHWAYETFQSEKELEFIVMATLDDIEANAEFVSEADLYVEVPSSTNNNNYANIHLIVQIAQEQRCDAIWPGWGHASENYKLPQTIESLFHTGTCSSVDKSDDTSTAFRRIIWIGPSSKSMIALGNKIGSSIIAQSAGVPCVPWSGDGVTTDLDRCSNITTDGIDPAKLSEACVNSPAEVKAVCERIGYPVMIKASEGGGGKGIRLCNSINEVEDSFRQVINEVRGSSVFVMRLVKQCRHLEVQILADSHGCVKALGSRDCSIQRRCQKIIEEGPIVAAPIHVVQEMEAAAVRMCEVVGYTSTGTVEFLYDPITVEHVVTECVGDINLPAAQLQVAMGIPIHNIPDIKRYLDTRQKGLLPEKHVIAARITAEHAEEEFRPTTGAVHELSFRSSRHVWGYFCIGSVGRIHTYADSQFGHIFASGTNRDAARSNLIMALKGMTIRGEIRTNVEALIRILETPDYITNNTHTTWLESRVCLSSPVSSRKVQTSILLAVFLGAVYEANRHFMKSEEAFSQKMHQGQLPPNIAVTYEAELVYKDKKFNLNCSSSGPHRMTVELNGSNVDATIRHISADSEGKPSASAEGGFLVSGGFDGRSRRVYYKVDTAGLRVTFDGGTYTFTKELDPTQVRVPVSGKLVRWLVPNDSNVTKGMAYAEMEIMKMYMQLHIHEGGKITHVLSEGAVFKAGDLLANLELADGMIVDKAVKYTEPFHPPLERESQTTIHNNLREFRAACDKVNCFLDGYISFDTDADEQLDIIFRSLLDRHLPFKEMEEALSILDAQLPDALSVNLRELLVAHSGELSPGLSSGNLKTASSRMDKLKDQMDSPDTSRSVVPSSELPVDKIIQAIEAQLNVQLQPTYSGPQLTRDQLEPIFEVLNRYEKGLVISAANEIVKLLNRYYEVEAVFHNSTDSATKVLQLRRTEFDTEKLVKFARSHQALKEKNKIICTILDFIRTCPVWQSSRFMTAYLRSYAHFMENLPLLHQALECLSDLSKPEYSPVSFKARQLLLTKKQKPFKERTKNLEHKLLSYCDRRPGIGCITPLMAAVGCGSPHGAGWMTSLINDLKGCFEDSLLSLFMHGNRKLRKMALYVYIRRHYDRRGVHDIFVHTDGEEWDVNNGTTSEVVSPLGWNSVRSLPGGCDTQLSSFLAASETAKNVPMSPALLPTWSINEQRHRRSSDKGGVPNGLHLEYLSRNACSRRERNEHAPGIQSHSGLMAVWTHRAVYSQDFLNNHCDELKRQLGDTRPGDYISGIPASSTGYVQESNCKEFGAVGNPSSADLSVGQHDSSVPLDANNFGIGVGSKLSHMLSAFGGTPVEFDAGTVAKSQQTIAIVFASVSDYLAQFEDAIREYADSLRKCMPPAPPSPDGRMLMIFIIEMDTLTQGDTGRSDKTNCGDGNLSILMEELNRVAPLLTSVSLYLVAFSFLESASRRRPSSNASFSQHSSSLYFENPDPLSDFTVTHYPRYVYYRCLACIPYQWQLNEGLSRCSAPVKHSFSNPHLSSLTSSSTGNECVKATRYTCSSASESGIRSIHSTMATVTTDSSGVLVSTFATVSKVTVPPGTCVVGTNTSANQPNKEAEARLCAEQQESNSYFSDSYENSSSAFCTTLNSTLKFVEEPLLRNVDISQFELLELKRLKNFWVKMIPMSVPHVHLFEAIPKRKNDAKMEGSSVTTAVKTTEKSLPRYFVRIVLQQDYANQTGKDDSNFSEQERYFVSGIDALEVATRSSFDRMAGNHMLMTVKGNIGKDFRTIANGAEEVARMLGHRYEQRLSKCCVSTFELRYLQEPLNEYCIPVRLVLDNPTGQALRVRKLVEVINPTTGERVFSAIDNTDSLSLARRGYEAAASPNAGPPVSSNTTGVPTGLSHKESTTASCKECGYDGQSVDFPHPLAGPLDQRRAIAASVSSVYIYDFLALFAEAIEKQWKTCPKYFFPRLEENHLGSPGNLRSAERRQSTQNIESTAENVSLLPDAALSGSQETLNNDERMHGICSDNFTGTKSGTFPAAAVTFLPDKVLEAVELALNSKGQLEEVYREPGRNECGMVAWKVTMRTPELPKGRRMILIGNDVSFQMGTFGVQEDLLFQRASELSRKEGIPRVYIAVNSGARMGIATDVLTAFKIEWLNPDNPSRGFKYLYLTEQDYLRLKARDAVVAEPVPHPSFGAVYRITDVIGSEIGLGVENLCGSGAIAGETCRAYNSVMSITFVTGRTVGIGAYLARLGQRVIQKATGAPILLTGYQALNRLIGRDVYTSNEEIGGTDVMHRNGVSHLVVKDDIEGCEAILNWLSYVPEHREGPLPIMVDPTDPITRPILYRPSLTTDDPRHMLTGCVDCRGQWLGGIFDRGSFREVMTEWARSVICGRARLGGIPVGVIFVETRVTESRLPADPAMPQSSELTIMRAGQVWFPDSAYKTAQAIYDFNQEELPLMIFANWRGFSGGQRDMFNEVLKFGSFIVDALVSYKHPCFVYIPPKAELRGGAWVVVDPRINCEHMEMYADTDCRGGVLEPTGTVEIKLREKALIEAASRLDPVLRNLAKEDKDFADQGLTLDAPKRQEIKEKKDKRIQELMPVYKQCAIHFADLQDTSTRMLRKHAIHDIVPWEKSRHYFYWRLRRLLILFSLRSEICKVNPHYSLTQAERLVYTWAEETGHSVESNYQFVHWACHSAQELSRRLWDLRRQYVIGETKEYCKDHLADIIDAVKTSDPSFRASEAGKVDNVRISSKALSTERSLAALSAITRSHDL